MESSSLTEHLQKGGDPSPASARDTLFMFLHSLLRAWTISSSSEISEVPTYNGSLFSRLSGTFHISLYGVRRYVGLPSVLSSYLQSNPKVTRSQDRTSPISVGFFW